MKRTILFLFFSISTAGFSQTNNIEQFLDDGGRTASTDIIKTDVSEILQANIPIIWEHRFTNNIALQAGIGLLTHSFARPLITPFNSDGPLYAGLKGGYSLYFQPVYYLDGFESFHVGASFRIRNHSTQASSFEWGIAFGKQWFIGRHISFDIETGVGLNFEKSIDGTSYIYIKDITDSNMTDFNSRFVVPLSFKIGYVL